MVKVRYLDKPYFIAVIICCCIFYSGRFKIPSRIPYRTLIKSNDITQISGKIISSPVKLSNQKYYSCKVSIFQTASDCFKNSKQTLISSASGIVTVFIPSELVESLFPGKLYSTAQQNGAFLYEAGCIFVMNGKFKRNVFYVNNTLFHGYEKSIFGKIDNFRSLCRLQFRRIMYSWKEGGGLLLALLSGAREYTDKNISDSFKDAGLSHILALSGMHLSLFSGIAMFLGKRFRKKKITFIIRVIALVIFVWFAGFSPSLLRAFICAILIIFSTIASPVPPDMFLILCFSFLIQCILSPADIYNVGFMLSYGALAGILVLNDRIRHFYNRFCSNYIAASLGASTSAQIFTAPITLKLFGSFSPAGIIATTIVSPLVTLYIYSGLIFIIIGILFPSTVKASGIFVNFEYTIIRYLVLFFSKAPAIKARF